MTLLKTLSPTINQGHSHTRMAFFIAKVLRENIEKIFVKIFGFLLRTGDDYLYIICKRNNRGSGYKREL